MILRCPLLVDVLKLDSVYVESWTHAFMRFAEECYELRWCEVWKALLDTFLLGDVV